MNASKKIVVTTTVDLDDLEYPIGDINETAATHARAITNDRHMMIRTSRGKIICREIAPNTYLGLTAERGHIDRRVFHRRRHRAPRRGLL